MSMNNPPHPGSILREDIVPEMALKIEHWLGIDKVVEPLWAGMQMDYDMWQARQSKAA